MRILTQLLLLATAIVLGAALAAATNPRPMLRALMVDLSGGMGHCARSPACRKAMDIPVRRIPVPDRGPFKPAPANLDRA